MWGSRVGLGGLLEPGLNPQPEPLANGIETHPMNEGSPWHKTQKCKTE